MRRRQARCGYRPGGCEGMPARQHRTALILRNCALASKLLSRVYSFARPFVDIALVSIPCAKLLLLRRRSAAGSIRIYRVSPMNRTNEMSRMLRKPFEHASRIRARVFRDCITKQVNLRCSNCGEARHPWDKRTCKSPGAGKWMLPLIFFMSLRKMEVLFCFSKLHADSQWPSTCCRGSLQGLRVKSLIRPDRNHHMGEKLQPAPARFRSCSGGLGTGSQRGDAPPETSLSAPFNAQEAHTARTDPGMDRGWD